ncbi:MAG TPA: ATP-dependent DNA helicase [Candidatus Onthocola gallistercoris]|uniref:ATP-dependent DNA helicase n=1 Tax=Candidatus Onthocola gallistercoris TaxID=2840876 RepID=A0A9D1HHY4_9FIRM|nr:ATP-dependent DNA helicase [Candidatus Onthocola gallistercoris]
MDKENVHVSVRNLVEFILRHGDIDKRLGELKDPAVMLAGSRLHRRIQKAAGGGYRAEVTLSCCYPADETLDITVEGRADGIITEKDRVVIDEIKGITGDVNRIEEPELLHVAQASCYAYMYGLQHPGQPLGLRITYGQLETEELRYFEQTLEWDILRKWFEDLISAYAVWARWKLDWLEERQKSITDIHFPFPYREGQKRMISGVYRTIEQQKQIFIQAPTGTGKTLGTVFPTLKAMGAGACDFIFYLTAKTIARTVAEDGCRLLQDHGLSLKRITLTAKEKICPQEECICQPELCRRAKGHFDRINDAIFDMITHEDAMDRRTVEDYAERYQVCPYEFQLDTAEWCDMVIGDYNYAFDPDACLKRLYADPMKKRVLLVDEAHNLVDRAREMYSASISMLRLGGLRKKMRGISSPIVRKAGKCIRDMKDYQRRLEESGKRGLKLSEIGIFSVDMLRLASEMEAYLKGDIPTVQRESIIDDYFEIRRFVNACDRMTDKYISYIQYPQDDDKDIWLTVCCVDPSGDLKEYLSLCRSTVFFSATLLPVGYYKELLSTTAKEDYDLYVTSPFSKENRLLLTATDVSSRYNRRGVEEYTRIAEYIRRIVRGKNGNYMVFFPSYVFMREVFEIFSERELRKAGSGIQVICQESGMDEAKKQQFLEWFQESPHSTTIGFCVLGGVFSEGIDLPSDRLIGAVIVGTGLPGLCVEREFLKDYFDEKLGSGFDYAYRFPGMNKVFQAGGRVIRSEKDVGVIALLDERFNHNLYQRLFPAEWSPVTKVTLQTLEETLEQFWTAKEEIW